MVASLSDGSNGTRQPFSKRFTRLNQYHQDKLAAGFAVIARQQSAQCRIGQVSAYGEFVHDLAQQHILGRKAAGVGVPYGGADFLRRKSGVGGDHRSSPQRIITPDRLGGSHYDEFTRFRIDVRRLEGRG